jgi:hypothetical protein
MFNWKMGQPTCQRQPTNSNRCQACMSAIAAAPDHQNLHATYCRPATTAPRHQRRPVRTSTLLPRHLHTAQHTATAPLSPSFFPKNRAAVQPHNLTGEPPFHCTADRDSTARGSSLPCASLGPGFTSRDAPLRPPVQILPPPLSHTGELLSPIASSPSSFSNHCHMLFIFRCSCRTPPRHLQPLSRRLAL